MPESTKPTPSPPPKATDAKDMPKLGPPQGPGELGRLAHYRVLKLLGRGGMGVVFLAEDTHLQREVALKVMRPKSAQDPKSKERFLREARAAAKVKHDNVVTIYQVGEENGVPFIAMEHLRGAPLDAYLKRQPQPNVAQVLRLAREMAAALGAAHERGLVHRDVKPANVWLEAPKGRVKILDFGLAWRDKDETHLTQSGTVAGTPAFMSPEQARGQALNHRSDLFSLGAVLYRLSTGQQPFKGDNVMEVMYALASDVPAAPRTLNAAVPVALNDLIMHLLAKKPENRPASASEVVETIRSIERAIASGGEVPMASGVNTPAAVPAGNSPWTDLDVDDTEPDEAILTLTRADERTPQRGPLIFMAIAGGVLVVAVAIAAIIALSGKGTPSQEVKAPEVERKLPDHEPPPVVVEKKDDAPEKIAKKELEKQDPEPKVTPKPPSPPPILGRFPPLDRSWVAKVQALGFAGQRLELIEELKRRNPGLLNTEITIGRMTDDGVGSVSINSTSVVDVTPIAALPHLKSLHIQSPQTPDRQRGKFSDLTQLAGSPLTKLSFGNVALTSLDGVKSLPALESLGLADVPVRDLSPLAGVKLRELRLFNTQLSSLEALRGLPIHTLNIQAIGTAPLKPLATLPLEHVDARLTRDRQLALYAILRKVPTLKTVNDIAVERFWKVQDRRDKHAADLEPELVLANPAPATQRRIRFSPDARTLLAADTAGTIRLWDLANGSPRQEFTNALSTDTAATGEFIPKTDLIAAGYLQGEVRFWSQKTGLQDGDPISFATRTSTIAVRGDGHLLAVCPGSPRLGQPNTDNCKVTVWELPARKKKKFDLTGHTAPVVAADFSSRGLLLATASVDRTVRIWSMATGKELSQLRTSDVPTSIEFSRDEKHLAVAGNEGHIVIYDWKTPRAIFQFHHLPVRAIAYGGQGVYLVAVGSDGWISVFDPAKDEPIIEFYGDSRVEHLTVSADGSKIATAHLDYKVRVWDWKKILAAAPK